ncbi:PrpF domain-containing protein [Streptomyces stramineus]
MIGHIAQAEGAPTPTLVLDRSGLPPDEERLRPVLTTIREWLADTGQEHVLKIAIVGPSDHPLFDLDYRFVQALPGGNDLFDFQGSCGHSILASVVAAEDRGWLPRLAPGGRVRVRVLNNGDHVVCEVDEVRRRSGSFTVHFLQDTRVRLRELLLTGRTTDQLLAGSGVYETSLVSMGNPYVFIDARALGLDTEEKLFGAGDAVYEQLLTIREAAADLLRHQVRDLPQDRGAGRLRAGPDRRPGDLRAQVAPQRGADGNHLPGHRGGHPRHGAGPSRRRGLPRGYVEIRTTGGDTAARAAVDPAVDEPAAVTATSCSGSA